MPSPPGPSIPLGNPMEWEITFRDVNGAPFDPDSGIQIDIEDPDGIHSILTYPDQISKKGVGVYSVTILSSKRGSWLGTGTGLLPDRMPVTTESVEQRVT